MKRSEKPLTFTSIVAGIGALSLAVEGCVYGPPPESDVYGPPSDTVVTTESEETRKDGKETQASKPSGNTDNNETVVYGPPPYDIDNPEVDVYGPPPEDLAD